MLILLFEMALTAFMLTGFGLMMSSGMKQVESFQVVIQFFVLPMFFLSGALFPSGGAPQLVARADEARSALLRRRRCGRRSSTT